MGLLHGPTEGGATAGGGMDLLGLGLLLVVALGVVLFVIILLTRGVFARDLTQALKRVTQQEQVLQEQADILERRLGQMELDYQAKLKRAETEAEQLLQDAKTQAMNVRTAAIEEAKHRARQLLLEAEQGRAQLKLEVARELNGQAVQRACESLRALLPSAELQALHGTLVNELLKTLAEATLTPSAEPLERIVVVTAQPLTAEDARQLAQRAAALAGRSIPVEVTTEPSLVAGCVVRMGAIIVDNSLPGRLGQREQVP